MQASADAITPTTVTLEAIPTSSALVLLITRSIIIEETNTAARATRERMRHLCSLGVSLFSAKNGKGEVCSRAVMPPRFDW